MSIYQPYTYLIGWSNLNKYYYGVRYAKGCNPNDLWEKYFTSSRHVKEFRKKYGEPDIIQIRKTFSSAKLAISWEERVLTRMRVLERDDFLNKNISGAILLTEDMRRSISESNKGNKKWLGKRHTEETKRKMRKPKTEKHKQSLKEAKQKDIIRVCEIAKRNGMIAANNARGKSPSEQVIKARSEGKIGLKYPKVICEHCGKSVANNTLKRWHGDNCKLRP